VVARPLSVSSPRWQMLSDLPLGPEAMTGWSEGLKVSRRRCQWREDHGLSEDTSVSDGLVMMALVRRRAEVQYDQYGRRLAFMNRGETGLRSP